MMTVKLIFTTTLFSLFCIFACSNSYANGENTSNFIKISYSDKALANKMLISLHHAIYEINHDEKYLIASLTEQEKGLLSNYNVTLSKAPKHWQNKFLQLADKAQNNALFTAGSRGSSTQTIDGYECYATVEETYQQAQALAEQNPLLASWIDIGDSWAKVNLGQGYDLMVLKITNSEIDKSKPILFVHSSMHAREYAPAALNLDFAKWLLENYQTHADAKWIVDNREVHLMLHMNPDGRKIAEQQVMQRKNVNENHCAGSTVGVDLNRNFAQNWGSTANGSSGNECSEVYRGIAPESEPETQAVSNYIRSLYPDERGELDTDAAPINKSGLHIDIHSYGRLILWPNGHTEEPSGNDNGFVHLGNKLAWFNEYAPQQSIGLYATDGTSDNVSYGELGVAAITFELGTSFFQSCSVYNSQIKPDNLAALIYAAKVSEAPYLLSLGADISSIHVNQSLYETTVVPGQLVDLDITASGTQTSLADKTQTITSFEYVIDGNFNDVEKINTINLTVSAQNGTSVTAQVNTESLDLGKHTLSVRARNDEGYYGVPTTVFINVAENSAPVPSFTASCQDLTCSFDASQSYDNEGDIAKYQWGINKGNDELEVFGEGETLSHEFSAAGELTIQLLVEDEHGAQAKVEQQVTLTNVEVIVVTPPKKDKSSSGGAFYWLLFVLLISSRVRKI